MRALTDAARLRRFMSELGREAGKPARVYLIGGSTAVMYGWRATTVDVDVKLSPERDDLLRTIALLKDQLNINVELASPDQFIPVRAGWEERSPFIQREGAIDFFHFDLESQALAKIERGHERDLDDVRSMLERNLVSASRLRESFQIIEPELYRFPAINPAEFRTALEAALAK